MQECVFSITEFIFSSSASAQFPGWMVNSEGSIFITTVNDNAVGVYTCTAFNSYGTMGQSEPTQVLLQVSLDLFCLVTSEKCFYMQMMMMMLMCLLPSSGSTFVHCHSWTRVFQGSRQSIDDTLWSQWRPHPKHHMEQGNEWAGFPFTIFNWKC